MKLLKEHIALEICTGNMKLGQVGKITTGWLADMVVMRNVDGFLCVQNGELYSLDEQTNVKIYPKGTKLEFEV